MARKISRSWSPIEDLPADWRSIADPSVKALVDAWLGQAEDLRQTASYDAFLARMRREWAIETGAIERLYRISEGATKTLIEQGLDAALLLHEDVDRSPDEVIRIIQDQHDAIAGLYQFVSGDRDLSKSYIRELHQVLTAHQPKYWAIDSLGNHVERDLPRGAWKTRPNNVGDASEGYHFEFCPPEQVDSEIERLLQLHREHEQIGVPPGLEAAWIQHRFTLIHPFTDGNGRVARCLATLVLLKARWFPLVVTRREGGYIEAIREADRGALKPLVELVGALQKRAVLQAFSLSDELPAADKGIGSILGAVRASMERDWPGELAVRERASALGDAVRDASFARLNELAAEVNVTINGHGEGFRSFARSVDEEESKDGFYSDIFTINVFQAVGYHPKFRAYRACARLVIDTDIRTEIAFPIHKVGGKANAVLGVLAMIYNVVPLGDRSEPIRVRTLTDLPFLFTSEESSTSVLDRFRPWLEKRLILGLDTWRKQIGA